jgi:tricarballylate dehydrogenase
LEVFGGGQGLVDALTRSAESSGITIRYNTRAVELMVDDTGVCGVVADANGTAKQIPARSVILASGGFGANAEWRARHLGPGWDLAKVRGSRFNTGDGIRMALDVGAMPWGHWSGCHSVPWDLNAPPFVDPSVGLAFNKPSYFLGIMVNARGERFVDEGSDLRSVTQAEMGREVLAQPSQFAWQIFDAKVADLLAKGCYRTRPATRVTAPTIEELVARLDGVNQERCLATVRQYNLAAASDRPFDPVKLDGRSTQGLSIPKSNWANPIDTPPFEAFAVTCGVTFTFGGLKVSPAAEVVDTDGDVIPNLFACGELAAGLFHYNYPASSGLTWGSVMGRVAGQAATASDQAKAAS